MSRVRMSCLASQLLPSGSFQPEPNWSLRSYPVAGALPLTVMVSRTSSAAGPLSAGPTRCPGFFGADLAGLGLLVGFDDVLDPGLVSSGEVGAVVLLGGRWLAAEDSAMPSEAGVGAPGWSVPQPASASPASAAVAINRESFKLVLVLTGAIDPVPRWLVF